MRITEEELQGLLTRFAGYKSEQVPSIFKSFTLKFFVHNVVPSFHTDIRVDATVMQANYNTYYKCKGSSFSAYVYYTLIKTMQKESFAFLRYRFINDEWYCFNNAPLFISVAIEDETIQQRGLFIEHVAHLSWSEFVKAYATGVADCRQATSEVFYPTEWYGIAHSITTIPFDFTSYTPSQKHNDYNAHTPWFVTSQRQAYDKKVEFSLSLTWSHASTLPLELNRFLTAFRQQMEIVPEQQQLTRYFTSSL